MLDWEIATLDNPLVDLGLLLSYWSPVSARYQQGLTVGARFETVGQAVPELVERTAELVR